MAATAHRAPAREHARPRRHAPRAPRRVSGPARAEQAPRTVRAGAPAVTLPAPSLPRLPSVADVLRGLPDARWLDRLIRGQGWVVLVGVALIGVVALQVSLLKLNSGIGASIERSSTLERSNADLRAEVSKLSSEERIQQVAGRLGLQMPHAGDVGFVRLGGPQDADRAARTMRAPDPEAAAPAPVASTTPTGADAQAIAQGQQVAPVTPAAQQTAPVQAAPTTPPATSGTTATPGTVPTPTPAPGQ
jgi:cell division protein FtsL